MSPRPPPGKRAAGGKPTGAALALVALTALFAVRVTGQALVAFLDLPWLPPMEAWYSGLVPYPLLLPAQVAILVAQAVIDWRVWRHGAPAPRPRLALALRCFSYLYALAMLLRWVVTRAHPIPIVFHWGLAAYCFALAAVTAGRTPRAGGR